MILIAKHLVFCVFVCFCFSVFSGTSHRKRVKQTRRVRGGVGGRSHTFLGCGQLLGAGACDGLNGVLETLGVWLGQS